VASWRGDNDRPADYAATDPKRSAGVGALPMQDPQAAAREARRSAGELGLRGGFCRPNPYGGHGLHDPVFDPVYDALEEARIPLALHGAGLTDMPRASRVLRRVMAPGTHP